MSSRLLSSCILRTVIVHNCGMHLYNNSWRLNGPVLSFFSEDENTILIAMCLKSIDMFLLVVSFIYVMINFIRSFILNPAENDLVTVLHSLLPFVSICLHMTVGCGCVLCVCRSAECIPGDCAAVLAVPPEAPSGRLPGHPRRRGPEKDQGQW